MKNRSFIISLSLILSLITFFSSCRKIEDNYISKTVLSVNNLNIPSFFDWKLTKTIKLTFESSKPTVIEIHDQNKQIYYFKGIHDGKDVLTSTITIPTYQSSFYINGTSYNVSEANQTINLDMQSKSGSASLNFSVGPETIIQSGIYTSYPEAPGILVLSPSMVLISYSQEAPVIGTFLALLEIENNTIITKHTFQISPQLGSMHDLTMLKSGQILFSFTKNEFNVRSEIYPVYINASVISVGNSYKFTEALGISPLLIPIDNNVFLAHYILASNQNTGRIKLMSFDGSGFTNISDSIDFASNINPWATSYLQLPNNNILLVSNSSPENLVFESHWNIYSTSNNTLSLVGEYMFSEITGILSESIQLGNKIITSGLHDGGYMHQLSIDDNNLTYASENQIIIPEGGRQSAAAINENQFLTTYFKYGLGGKYYLSFCEVIGNQVINTEEIQLSNHEYRGDNVIRKLDDNHFILLALNREGVDNNIYGYIVTINNNTNGDSDGDGVADESDDYPYDPLRAFNNYFPANSYGSLAFEDLWPGKGDYDFNDMVIDYRFKIVTNAQNEVVNMLATFPIKAAGASYVNGFGFSLPDAIETIITDMTITGNEISESIVSLSENGWETGQLKPTTIVFDNIFNILPHPGIGIGVNTELNAPFVNYDTIRLSFTPSEIINYTHLGLHTWNPFIIVNMVRSHEVHLPFYEPTEKFDLSLFGQWEDNSSPGQERYFITSNNLPWGIDIPHSFIWPVEKTEITEAYSKFAAWAESGGTLYNDWYLNQNDNINESKVYLGID